MTTTAQTPAVTLTLTGLPEKCPNCYEAPPDGSWPLHVYGHELHIACPRCWIVVAPVRAVAAPQPAAEPPLLTSLDSDDYNDPNLPAEQL